MEVTLLFFPASKPRLKERAFLLLGPFTLSIIVNIFFIFKEANPSLTHPLKYENGILSSRMFTIYLRYSFLIEEIQFRTTYRAAPISKFWHGSKEATKPYVRQLFSGSM